MDLALQVALDGDLTEQALRGYYNLSDFRLLNGQPADSARLLERGLALARERGDRAWEREILAQTVNGHVFRGEWDEALAVVDALREAASDQASRVGTALVPLILASRGDVARLEKWAAPVAEPSEWHELALMETLGRAIALFTVGRHSECEPLATGAALELSRSNDSTKAIYSDVAIDMLVHYERFDELDALTPASDVRAPAGIAGQLARARGLSQLHRGDRLAAEQTLSAAVPALRAGASPMPLARGLVDLGTLLSDDGRLEEAQPLLREARSIFVGLRAEPWIERTDALLTPVATAQ